VDQYRTYLRAELGKLRNAGDGGEFLEKSLCQLASFDLPGDADRLSHAFADQDLVDAYVRRLDRQALVALTGCCGRWRDNGIAAKLHHGQTVTFVDVPVEAVLLNQAEGYLAAVFKANGDQLIRIARDPIVLGAKAYCDRQPGEVIAFRWCLANREPGPGDLYRVFDGMHRAIQMIRNEDKAIPLCVIGDL
jgi:hypothetical protein